jgi:predicted Zn-dependent peptidase
MGSNLDITQFTLQNGIRVVHLPRPESAICHCGLMIEAGSRDELTEEMGLAHFIEHCLFKGTKKRRTFHILNRLDNVGGEVNAYTGKEDTAIHASFLNVHAERAIELIADIAFASTFPEKELEKEKEVIIDEIQSYEDSPSEMIFDAFDELIFSGHPLGKPILGDEQSVRSFHKKDILRYMSRRYHPETMVFSFHGNIPTKKLKQLCEKHLSAFVSNTALAARTPSPEVGQKIEVVDKKSNQAHFILGCRAYDANEDKKLAFIVLNNLLGGPAMNSLLNLNIRETYGIAYNLESHYQAYSDTGLFQIYMGTDKNQVDRGVALIHKEMKKLRDISLGTRQLHNAKEQIKGHIALSNDGGSSIMLGMAKSILLYDRIEELDEILKSIDAISAADLMEVANELWAPERLSTLTYL